MTYPSKIVVWFRRDLRLSDNPALAQAVAEKAEIVPLFIFDSYLLHHPETGFGRVQFLLGCLDSLQKNLEYLGSTLIRRYGDQPQVLVKVATEVGADAVYWNEDSEREWRTRTDCCAIETLKEAGIKVRCFQSEAVLPAGGKESYDLNFFTPLVSIFARTYRPKTHPSPICAIERKHWLSEIIARFRLAHVFSNHTSCGRARSPSIVERVSRA